jgi:hypothetical protein
VNYKSIPVASVWMSVNFFGQADLSHMMVKLAQRYGDLKTWFNVGPFTDDRARASLKTSWLWAELKLLG